MKSFNRTTLPSFGAILICCGIFGIFGTIVYNYDRGVVSTPRSSIDSKLLYMKGIKYFADKNRPGNCFAVFENYAPNSSTIIASIASIDCDKAGIE